MVPLVSYGRLTRCPYRHRYGLRESTVGVETNERVREAPVGHRAGGQQHLEDLTGPLRQLGVRRASGQLSEFVHGRCKRNIENYDALGHLDAVELVRGRAVRVCVGRSILDLFPWLEGEGCIAADMVFCSNRLRECVATHFWNNFKGGFVARREDQGVPIATRDYGAIRLRQIHPIMLEEPMI